MSKPRLYRGMRDFLPHQAIARERVLDTIKEVFKLWGYVPIETPAIELLDTLLGKYGGEADKLIYRLDHPDQLGLRYDLTVPLARFFAQHRHELPKPFRRYQIQSVWRAERAQKQKGRFREFVQCDVDIVGSDSPLADAEILAITIETLTALGFSDFKVLLNHRKILFGLVRQAGFSENEELSVLRSVDKWDKIGLDGVVEELTDKGFERANVEKLISILNTDDDGRSLLEVFASSEDESISYGARNLLRILDILSMMGDYQRYIEFTPRMARGLDYYTGAIFETVLESLPNMGSITGGGRFDDLIGMFVGERIPACGTTVGLDRILAAMEELGLLPKTKTQAVVMVALFSEEYTSAAIKLAQEFRKANIPAEMFIEPKKLGKQFEYANKWGIPYVALVGEDEAKSGLCVIKDMSTGEQFKLKPEEAVKFIKNRLTERESDKVGC